MDLYPSVPRIECDIKLNDKNSFEYCEAKKYFVLIIPYTKRKEILIERLFADNTLSWVLLGGSLRNDLKETFIEAANRHASRSISHIELGEIEPIAFLKNRFSFEDRKCVHEGIAFIGRIRNSDPYTDLKNTTHTRAYFVNYDSKINSTLTHNEGVLNLAYQYLLHLNVDDAPEEEVSENLKYKNNYIFHNRVTKKIFKAFGHLYKNSISDLYDKIDEIIINSNSKKVLDVACGENAEIINIAKMPGIDLVVGNDVSWSQIQLMNNSYTEEIINDLNSFLFFSNHDARKFPFSDNYFDVVICKNVLHHMDSLDSVNKLISESIRIGKIAIIIDVLNPKYENKWGRLRHKYYTNFLHDVGQFLLNRKQFQSLTEKPERTDLFEMKTIRGIYMFAIFKKE